MTGRFRAREEQANGIQAALQHGPFSVKKWRMFNASQKDASEIAAFFGLDAEAADRLRVCLDVTETWPMFSFEFQSTEDRNLRRSLGCVVISTGLRVIVEKHAWMTDEEAGSRGYVIDTYFLSAVRRKVCEIIGLEPSTQGGHTKDAVAPLQREAQESLEAALQIATSLGYELYNTQRRLDHAQMSLQPADHMGAANDAQAAPAQVHAHCAGGPTGVGKIPTSAQPANLARLIDAVSDVGDRLGAARRLLGQALHRLVEELSLQATQVGAPNWSAELLPPETKKLIADAYQKLNLQEAYKDPRTERTVTGSRSVGSREHAGILAIGITIGTAHFGEGDIVVASGDESTVAPGDRAGRDVIKPSAGGDITGMAIGRGAVAAVGSTVQLSTPAELKNALDALCNEVNRSNIAPAEKAAALPAILWLLDNVEKPDQPADAEQRVAPIRKAGKWVCERVVHTAEHASGAFLGHWAVQLLLKSLPAL